MLLFYIMCILASVFYKFDHIYKIITFRYYTLVKPLKHNNFEMHNINSCSYKITTYYNVWFMFDNE